MKSGKLQAAALLCGGVVVAAVATVSAQIWEPTKTVERIDSMSLRKPANVVLD